MATLLQDAAAFACAEMLRRLIGLAWVQDFTSIPDTQARAHAESLAIKVALAWLKNRHSVKRIDDLVEMMVEAKSSL